MMGKQFTFKEGERVQIYHPDVKYHDKAGVVVEVDTNDTNNLCYNVHLDGTPESIPFWLPEHRLRPERKRTLTELIPGDILKNRAGLDYEVIEPLSPVFFVRPLGSPVIQYISAEELANNGFTIRDGGK